MFVVVFQKAQFIVFYACQFKSSFCDLFIQNLLEIIADRGEVVVVRKNAASFLGSFIARAKYLKGACDMEITKTSLFHHPLIAKQKTKKKCPR